MKLTFGKYTQQNDVVRTLHCFSIDFIFKRPICNTNPVRLLFTDFIAKFHTESARGELLEFLKKEILNCVYIAKQRFQIIYRIPNP